MTYLLPKVGFLEIEKKDQKEKLSERLIPVIPQFEDIVLVGNKAKVVSVVA